MAHPLAGIPKPRVRCPHCTLEFGTNNLGRHMQAHHAEKLPKGKKTRKFSKLDVVNGGEFKSTVTVNQMVQPTVDIRTMQAMFDCPHCSGILVLSKNHVNHYDNARDYMFGEVTDGGR
jgi:uncharacterized C2H2 Zn-finger protein